MTPAYRCPNCDCRLERHPASRNAAWVCGLGCGVCLTTAVLAQSLAPHVVSQTVAAARDSATPSQRCCPSCRNALRAFRASAADATLELDACPPCSMLWFDQGELERMGVRLALRRGAMGPLPADMVERLRTLGKEPDFDERLDGAVATLFGKLDEIYVRWRSQR